ncbi:hypothetical protein Tco_1299303 [Tanacetum coccineum]
MIVEENLHVQFRNQFNGNAGTKACDDAVQRVLLMLDSNPQEMIKKRLLENQEKKAVIQVNVVDEKTSIELPLDPNMPELEDYSIFEDDEDVDAKVGMNNLDITIQVSLILTTRIHKYHLLDQVIGDLQSAL